MNPKEKALKLPQKPGVYIMLDKNGEVIYVGKAKKLYNRVNSYFRANSSHNSKTRIMVSNVRDFDYIITDTEFEALVLENSLIKRHKPRFNILLKDDKGYPFIRLSNEEYPRFSIASKQADDKARYFGPYGGRVESKRAIETLCSLLKLPTCSRRFPADIGKGRPCLNSHIGRCDAVCSGKISKEEYNERINRACMLLSGKTADVTKFLEEEMNLASENLEFEKAAKLRDELRSISVMGVKQKIISGLLADSDIIGFYEGATKTAFSILHYIDGTLLESETIMLETPAYQEPRELLEEFIARYYSQRGKLPKEITVSVELSSAEAVEDWLSSLSERRVHIVVPQRGEKLKLLRMAEKNAEEKITAVTKKEEREIKVLEKLKKLLMLPEIPARIEAFDISNISGSNMVAGMVVFKNGSPTKKEYRKFKIKTLSDQDDPRAMREVLERRFSRLAEGDERFSEQPDLLLLDGGITQVRAVKKAFAERRIDVPVFGMVKDNKHTTRALVDENGAEIGISATPDVFKLIYSIQEEVHRYSIEYHKKLRSKSMTQSELTKIDGIGKVRARELLAKFKTISAIKEADVATLCSVLPVSAAEAVYKYYHETDGEKK